MRRLPTLNALTDEEAELAAANAKRAFEEALLSLEDNAYPRHLREPEHDEAVHYAWWRAFESARDLAALAHGRGTAWTFDHMNDAVFHGSELFARCGFDASTDSDTLIEVATLMGSFGDASTAQSLLDCAEEVLLRGPSPKVEAAAWMLRLALGRSVETAALAQTIARLGAERDEVASRTMAVLTGAVAILERDAPALRGAIAGLLASHEGAAKRSKSPGTLIETSAFWLWLTARRAKLAVAAPSPYWPIDIARFTLGASRASEPASSDLCELLDYCLGLPEEDFDAETMAERAQRIGFESWSHGAVVERANELVRRFVSPWRRSRPPLRIPTARSGGADRRRGGCSRPSRLARLAQRFLGFLP